MNRTLGLATRIALAAIAALLVTADRAAAQQYTLDQTLSDQAQRNTIAFDGLAFLTGSLGADSFFPPGKVADFWGFQYLRDNDPTQMGHNTDFLTRAANNVLYVLDDSQLAELVALAEGQVDAVNQYGYDRFVLMDAFRRLLAGDLPAGSAGLDPDAVRAFSAELYRLDGEISFERAQVMGGILSSLDPDQRAYLDAMVGHGMLDWPNPGDQLDPRDLTHDVQVAVMTYAGDLFSWYAGSVEADVYFCPERQGTYFGSFYLKDAKAFGNPDYTIPSTITGDMGEAFLEALTAEQAALVTALVDRQRDWLYEIVDRRTDVATELRRFIAGEEADRDSVLALMERYGELDGDIILIYVDAFVAVSRDLTAAQQAELDGLRTELGVTLPDGAYLYSEPIPMPGIPSSDFLFLGAEGSVLAIPAVARAEGAGAFFTSRLDVFNASDAAMSVAAVYTPRADLGGSSRTATFDLAPWQMLTADDPLGQWFACGDGEAAVGSLMLAVTAGDAADLMVSSVITARTADGAEYGQGVPAEWSAGALQAGETAYLNTTVDAARSRVNFGAMALADGTVLAVRPVDPADTALASGQTLTIDRGGNLQLNDVAAAFALGDAADYLLEVRVEAGSALVYASVLDGTATAPGTSDATTILPVEDGARTVTLLELGPIQGYDEFSGSASISNLSATAAQVSAELHRRGVPGVAATASLTIPAGDTVGAADFVGELFGASDVGTVVLRTSDQARVMATGREFSILRDDQGEPVGTAGQLIPGLTDDDLLVPGVTYHLLGLRQRQTSAGLERSHVAAFNPGTEEVEVTLHLHDGASGADEGSTTLTVRPGELVQANSVVAAIAPAQDGAPKRLAVTVDGPVFLAAFRVNPSGDPVTIQPQAASGGTGGGSLVLSSSAFADQGTLPVDSSCDGAGVSPPLSWTGTPAGTVELALLMTTLAPDGLKWNWVLYGVPTDVTSLPEGGGGIGTPGQASGGPLLAYSPPCSQGPGPKLYTFTLYALSAAPTFSVPEEQRTGEVVSEAISGITLASTAISATYTRP